MLNPDMVAGLRAQIAQSSEISDFQGYAIKRTPLAIASASSAKTVTVSDAWLGQLQIPEKVFGIPTDSSCLLGVRAGEQVVPEITLSTVPGARIIGNDFLIGRSGEAFGPSPITNATDLKRLVERNRENHQGFAVESVNGVPQAYFAANRQSTLMPYRAVFLHNLEPANYGSFLFRQLPQMILLREVALDFDAYIVPDRTPWLREALQLVGLPSRPIFTVREIAGDTFTSVSLFNEFDSEGFFSGSMCEKLTSLARTVWPSTNGPSGRKIYISRRLGTTFRPDYRALINERTTEDVFREHGFVVVYPEILNFAEQVGLFRRAKMIAGPSGSGMLNAIFSDPGTKVLDIESFHYTVRQHAKIYSSTSKIYAFLFGTIDKSSARPLHIARWAIPEELLREVIEWLES